MRITKWVALVVILAACARDTTGYEGPFGAEVRRAIPAIERSTGLTFTAPPRLEIRDRDQVRAFLERQFAEQLTPLELAGVEQAYKLLGMLPDTLDLRRFLLDLLTEQVAGYYDPATKVLYVVKGGAPELTSVTINHELIHALQDQHFPLDSIRSLKGDNDRQVALQAVIEGQAVYEQMSVMLGGGDVGARLPGGWAEMREMIRSGQEGMPKFAAAPTLLQETLLFPYLNGAEYVREVKTRVPPGNPLITTAMSTEQILHPEKRLGTQVDLPTRIQLPPPRGGTLVHEDNLGEFETRLFLYEHLQDVAAAVRGAAGWDGDRYQVVQTATGTGIAWLTVWDDADEAAEFVAVMERVVERRFGGAPRGAHAGDAQRWSAGGRELILSATTLGGRAVVVWEDLPAGATLGVIALSGVTMREE